MCTDWADGQSCRVSVYRGRTGGDRSWYQTPLSGPLTPVVPHYGDSCHHRDTGSPTPGLTKDLPGTPGRGSSVVCTRCLRHGGWGGRPANGPVTCASTTGDSPGLPTSPSCSGGLPCGPCPYPESKTRDPKRFNMKPTLYGRQEVVLRRSERDCLRSPRVGHGPVRSWVLCSVMSESHTPEPRVSGSRVVAESPDTTQKPHVSRDTPSPLSGDTATTTCDLSVPLTGRDPRDSCFPVHFLETLSLPICRGRAGWFTLVDGWGPGGWRFDVPRLPSHPEVPLL